MKLVLGMQRVDLKLTLKETVMKHLQTLSLEVEVEISTY